MAWQWWANQQEFAQRLARDPQELAKVDIAGIPHKIAGASMIPGEKESPFLKRENWGFFVLQATVMATAKFYEEVAQWKARDYWC